MWIGLRTNDPSERKSSNRPPRVTVKELEEDPPAPPSRPSSADDDADGRVPTGLRIGAAWAWRMVVIGIAVVAFLWFLAKASIVVIPLVVAVLLAAMFQPMAAWLMKHGWNKSLAALLVLVTGLAAVAGTLTFVVDQFIKGVPDFGQQAVEGLKEAQKWLESGPYGLDGQQVTAYLSNVEDSVSDWFSDNQTDLAQSALDIGGSVATSLIYTLTGFFLVLFCTYFFLRDGRSIWEFLTGMLPARAVEPTRYAGGAGWSSMVQYMRTMVLVALVDAFGIGLGLWILDIPLWLPLAALVFLGGFIPIVGATVSGSVAVMVALIGTDNPLWNALFVLLIVLAVQQIESNILHPVMMSRAVKLHPLAIVLSVTTGGILAGIVGALIAVPALAMINAFVRALSRYREAHRHAEEEDVTLEGEESVALRRDEEEQTS